VARLTYENLVPIDLVGASQGTGGTDPMALVKCHTNYARIVQAGTLTALTYIALGLKSESLLWRNDEEVKP